MIFVGTLNHHTKECNFSSLMSNEFDIQVIQNRLASQTQRFRDPIVFYYLYYILTQLYSITLCNWRKYKCTDTLFLFFFFLFFLSIFSRIFFFALFVETVYDSFTVPSFFLFFKNIKIKIKYIILSIPVRENKKYMVF